ncbi:MAG: hypothetical protein D9C04_02920 [Nitrosopumilus sp. B06]|nr:MAG: hypothetical protein D9C04_02920 [Nitrosopumilus sp. B06]
MLTLAMVPAIMLVPFGMEDVFAEQVSMGTAVVPYTISDIGHAFGAMELFVTLDGNYHLLINETIADSHTEITELDIVIAYDFATHSDAIINAMKTGPVGQINELESTNPELWTYSWPSNWWGAYVAWWHIVN